MPAALPVRSSRLAVAAAAAALTLAGCSSDEGSPTAASTVASPAGSASTAAPTPSSTSSPAPAGDPATSTSAGATADAPTTTAGEPSGSSAAGTTPAPAGTAGDTASDRASAPSGTGRQSATTAPTATATGAQTRPTREEVTQGLQAFYRKNSPGGRIDTDRYAACVVDTGYDSWSQTTRTALAAGRIDRLPYDDLNEFTSVAGDCVAQQAQG